MTHVQRVPARGKYSPHLYPDRIEDIALKEGHFPTVFGEMRYLYTNSPRPDETVDVLLHGVGGSWSTWGPLLTEVRESQGHLQNVVVIELPGFGQSENLLDSLNAELVGQEVVQLVHSMGWRKFRVIGHSMGGFLALDLAAHQPTGLLGTASISGFYYTIVDTVKAPVSTLFASPISAGAYIALAAISIFKPQSHPLLKSPYQKLLPILLKALVAHPDKMNPETLNRIASSGGGSSFKKAAKNAFGYDCTAKWSSIRTRLVAIGGDRDRMVPKDDLTRLAGDAGSNSFLLLETGHFAHIERPHEVYEILRQNSFFQPFDR